MLFDALRALDVGLRQVPRSARSLDMIYSYVLFDKYWYTLR